MSPLSILSLPELFDVIVRAPSLGLPSPLFSRDPQFVLELSQDLALATPQGNNPCQLYVGSPPARERWKFEIYTMNERQTTRIPTLDPTRIQYWLHHTITEIYH